VSQIQGKVAAFASEREVVINVGRKDGVRVGMKFAILSLNGAEIKDPDTGETLGTLDRDRVKAHVQALEVHDRMSVCATYVATFDDALEALLEPHAASYGRSSVARLRARYPSLKSPGDYVRVGDRVQQVDEG
jgi:hypothetical protein